MKNVEDVINKWQFKHQDVSYLFYPSKNSHRLVISFGAMGETKYSRVTWFCNDIINTSDTSYLFLTDANNGYYSCKKREKTYLEIINKSIRETVVDRKKVFTIGNSMGASGAIYHALVGNLAGIISVNPQFDEASAKMHSSTTWYECIINSNYKNIIDLVNKTRNLPKIYVEYSNYMPDFSASIKLLKHWNEKGGIALSYHNKEIIHANSRPNLEDIRVTLDFMANFRGFND
jgi:hypothetical protein